MAIFKNQMEVRMQLVLMDHADEWRLGVTNLILIVKTAELRS